MAEEDIAPVAVVIAVASLLLLALTVLTAICCLQRRRRIVDRGGEPIKAVGAKNLPAAAGPIYRTKADIQIAVNKMEDLLQHNTQQLLHPQATGASNLYVETTNLYVDSLHNNEYEVPNSERSCYGYYDLRDVVRPAAVALR